MCLCLCVLRMQIYSAYPAPCPDRSAGGSAAAGGQQRGVAPVRRVGQRGVAVRVLLLGTLALPRRRGPVRRARFSVLLLLLQPWRLRGSTVPSMRDTRLQRLQVHEDVKCTRGGAKYTRARRARIEWLSCSTLLVMEDTSLTEHPAASCSRESCAQARRSGAERGEVASYYAERVAWSPRACCAGSSLYSTAARRENRKILLPGFPHALRQLGKAEPSLWVRPAALATGAFVLPALC